MSERVAQESQITEGPLAKGIILFGIPMVLAMTLHGAFNLVDAWFVGQLPDPEIPLAAIGNCDPLLMVATIAANGICTAAVAIVARYIGAKDIDRARHAAAQSMILVGAICALAGLLGGFFAREIGELMGAKGPVLDLLTDYLRVMFGGIFTMVFLLQFTAILRGAGDAKGPSVALIAANVINVVIDPFLMFGWFGLPAMGLMGAAWATVGARLIGCGIAAWFLFRFKIKLWPKGREWRPDRKLMKELLAIGAPNSIQLAVRVFALLALIALLNFAFVTDTDQSPTAAFGIGVRIDMLLLVGASGWGAAAATYVGQNLGAGKPERAARAGWIAAGLGCVMFTLLGGLLFLFASPIAGLFASGDAKVLEAATLYIQYLAPTLGIGSVAVVLGLALNGAGSTRAPLVIDLVAFALLILPFAGLSVLTYGYGWQAILVAAASANVALAILYAFWFRLGKWKKIKLSA